MDYDEIKYEKVNRIINKIKGQYSYKGTNRIFSTKKDYKTALEGIKAMVSNLNSKEEAPEYAKYFCASFCKDVLVSNFTEVVNDVLKILHEGFKKHGIDLLNEVFPCNFLSSDLSNTNTEESSLLHYCVVRCGGCGSNPNVEEIKKKVQLLLDKGADPSQIVNKKTIIASYNEGINKTIKSNKGFIQTKTSELKGLLEKEQAELKQLEEEKETEPRDAKIAKVETSHEKIYNDSINEIERRQKDYKKTISEHKDLLELLTQTAAEKKNPSTAIKCSSLDRQFSAPSV